MHALKTDEKTGNARRAEQLQACIQLRVRDDDDGIDLYVHLKQLTLLIIVPFVWAGLPYKPWLKVLLARLV